MKKSKENITFTPEFLEAQQRILDGKDKRTIFFDGWKNLEEQRIENLKKRK